ncbi:hypothetical protein, partial [Acinetobacter baumannii]|uniref:hypothetical protein n=1 Tax=Acinetobacter baumannii TaxID=470 RepID=UPI0033920DE0
VPSVVHMEKAEHFLEDQDSSLSNSDSVRASSWLRNLDLASARIEQTRDVSNVLPTRNSPCIASRTSHERLHS